MTTQPASLASTRAREVYAIAQCNGKSYWIKVGASFTNQDGSETILLDALPVTGRLHIRDRKPQGEQS